MGYRAAIFSRGNKDAVRSSFQLLLKANNKTLSSVKRYMAREGFH